MERSSRRSAPPVQSTLFDVNLVPSRIPVVHCHVIATSFLCPSLDFVRAHRVLSCASDRPRGSEPSEGPVQWHGGREKKLSRGSLLRTSHLPLVYSRSMGFDEREGPFLGSDGQWNPDLFGDSSSLVERRRGWGDTGWWVFGFVHPVPRPPAVVPCANEPCGEKQQVIV
eukprot:scaffold762_cov363-Pavlova_lutheri.AAC.50